MWVVTEPVDHSPDIDPLMRQAIAWVVRLTSGAATTADADELKRWRSQSQEHEAAFRRAAKLWKSYGNLASELSERDELSRRRAKVSQMVGRRFFIGGAAAAAAVAVGYVGTHPPLALWPSWNEMLADYRTGKGEQRKIAVSPEISLELNTLTSVSVRSPVKNPRIELISGEAAITATNTREPLVVIAGDVRIVTSHATFNARCIDGAIAVTCLVGEVDVQQDGSTLQLRTGQQVSYSNAGDPNIADVDVDQAASWRSGMLVFHNKPLIEVIDEVNRYRPGRIIITNADLGHRLVNGTFRRNQLDTFIAQVQQLFGAKVTTLPAGLTLLS